MTNPTLNSVGGRRSRRSWSDEEKRRIVAEAVLPGASVADIARRHGVNANLVFNWRKIARAALSGAEPVALAVSSQANASLAAAEKCELIPIGVIGRAEDEEPALGTARQQSWPVSDTEDGRFGRLQSGHSRVVGGPNRAARISVALWSLRVCGQCRVLDFQTRPDVPGRPATDQQMRMYMEAPLPPSPACRCRQGRLQRAHWPPDRGRSAAAVPEERGATVAADRSPTRSAACGRATSCRCWPPVPACGR